MSNIVVVNSDLHSCSFITEVLSKACHQVSCLSTTQGVFDLLQQQGGDLVVIDDALPFQERLELITLICKNLAVPILLLSELSKQADLLEQLQAGADQSLIKPFSKKALLIHIDVLLRRVELERKRSKYQNCSQHFSVKISHLALTETEEQLVQYLSSKEGDIIPKATLQKEVLKKDLSLFDRNLDVHISNIRRKMANAGLSKLHIKTVHGKGYCFSENLRQ